MRLVSGVGQSCGTEPLPVGSMLSMGRWIRIELNCRTLASVTENGSVWEKYPDGCYQKFECGGHVTCRGAFTAHKAALPPQLPARQGAGLSGAVPALGQDWVGVFCEMVGRT